MVTTEELHGYIDDIERLPDLATRSIKGLIDEQLDTPFRQGGWSVRQVIHHIADSHMNAYLRMRLIVTENHPTLSPYDQDLWAELADSKLSPKLSLAMLDGLHQRWGAFLRNLPKEAWERTAFHPENGDVTLGGLLKSYAHHGLHHLQQITDLRERMNWDHSGLER